MVFHLKIITPRKIVLEEDASSITVPSADGEITILPRHENLFSMLKEGIIKIKINKFSFYTFKFTFIHSF